MSPASARHSELAQRESHESHGLSVTRNGIWSLFGNGGFAACQLGMLVVMARLGSPEIVGQYALALALTSPVFLLFALQLRTLLAADSGENADLNTYLSVRLTTTSLAAVAAVLIGWQYMSPGTAMVAWAVVASKAIDSIHDLAYGLFWRSNRMDCIARSMLLRGGCGLTAFAAVFSFTRSPSAAVFALCATWLLVLLLYDKPVAEGLISRNSASAWRLAWSTAAARRLVWLGFPAGLLSWLVSLQIYVPRYFVQQEMGDAGLGIFTALASIFVGLELAALSFNYAAVPRMARYANLRQAAPLGEMVRRLTGLGAAFAVLLVAGSLVAGHWLISLLFGPSYAEHSAVFTTLTVAFAIRAATMPTAMTLRAVNAYWSLVAVQLFAVFGVFVACAFLMPRYGLEGCAMACVIGCALDGLGRTILHLLFVVRPIADAGATAELLQAA